MNASLYLETTIVSYLVAKPSRDAMTAGYQAATLEWWNRRLKKFDVFISDVVLAEAAAGDAGYAKKRLAVLAKFPLLRPTQRSQALAHALVDSGVLPAKAVRDATHIALAAAHHIHFLLTWNCRHIANAEMLRQVERVCRAHSLECPVVCTPHELMEGSGRI
jgi:hypothetical protein